MESDVRLYNMALYMVIIKSHFNILRVKMLPVVIINYFKILNLQLF